MVRTPPVFKNKTRSRAADIPNSVAYEETSNHRISGAFFVINIKSKRLRVLIRFRRELTAPEPAVRSFLTNTTNDLAASCAFGGAEGAS
jgi:hypothetical protein